MGYDHDILFNELKIITRKQLSNYPDAKGQSKIKLLIKSIIKKKNMFFSDKFFWPNGLLATSLEWSHRVVGSNEDLESLRNYYDCWIKKGVPLKNSDYTINGYSMIYLYEITREKKYLETIEYLVNYLKYHIKSQDGSLPYRKKSNEKIFVDSLGMICPFLCRYGNMNNDDDSINLAVKQLTNFLEYGMDEKSHLPYHGYDSQDKIKLGIVGWGRALGWMLIGLVDSLEYIPSSHPKYKLLNEELDNIVYQVFKYQKENGAFSWQIPANDGYADSSSTSMIAYAVKRGVMLNFLSKSYLRYTDLALNFLHNVTKNGFVYQCSAECKGLGMYPQRYNNFPWSQGPTTSLTAISMNQN